MAIGFVGIGNMGWPMAEKLIGFGDELVVHDVREAALEPLVQRQARPAASPREVADRCATAFVSLPTLPALEEVDTVTGVTVGLDPVGDYEQPVAMAFRPDANGRAYVGERAGVVLDVDLDGDLDLIVNNVNMPLFVYENKGSGNHFLQFSFNYKEKNPFAIGTKVYVYKGDQINYDQFMPTKGFQSSMDYRVHFGLGKAENHI